MNLVVDQGNRICKVAVYMAGEQIFCQSVPCLDAALLSSLRAQYPELSRAIYCSVGSWQDDTPALLREAFANLIVLDGQTPIPIGVHYDRKQLGGDRLAAVVGAYAHQAGHGAHTLVIDAGTAITYELVDPAGNYLGGNIALGLYMRMSALHKRTARLPLVESLEPREEGFGHTTEEAIQLGALQGLAYEIEGYIRSLESCGPLRIYITGGDAQILSQQLKRGDITVLPELVLDGLNYILDYNNDAK